MKKRKSFLRYTQGDRAFVAVDTVLLTLFLVIIL